jgi:hypothetical protein
MMKPRHHPMAGLFLAFVFLIAILYEHIIRGEKDFNAIRKYIVNNPINWQIDEENAIHRVLSQSNHFLAPGKHPLGNGIRPEYQKKCENFYAI